MRQSSRFLSCFLSLFVVTILVIPIAPAQDLSQGPLLADGALTGHILDQDMKSPVRNVVVKLRNINTYKEYASEPTNPLGQYNITAIEEGRYIMGVQAPSGAYNFQYSLYLKGTETAKLSVALAPKAFAAAAQGSGGAGASESGGALAFFKSPAGILSLFMAAEVVLFATVLIEKETSPIR